MMLDGFDVFDVLFHLECALRRKLPTPDRLRLHQLATAGDLHEFLCDTLQPLAPATDLCPTAKAFHELVSRIEQAGLALSVELTPRTSTEVLVPKKSRYQNWCDLESILGVELPPLEYGNLMTIFMLFTSGLPTALTIGWLAVCFHAWFLLLVPPGIILFVIAFIAHDRVLRFRFRRHLPRQLQTLAGLAYLLAITHPQGAPKNWTRTELWAAVRYALSEYTGINPRRIRRKTTFTDMSMKGTPLFVNN